MRVQIVLLLAVIGSALAVVNSQHQAHKVFIALQQAKWQQRQLEEEWGRLQLEQSTWAMHARVGKIAGDKLQMQLPDASQERMVFAPHALVTRP
jgi:cell division protein FtsL